MSEQKIEFKGLVKTVSGQSFWGTVRTIPADMEIEIGQDKTDMLAVGNIFAGDGKSLIFTLATATIQPMNEAPADAVVCE